MMFQMLTTDVVELMDVVVWPGGTGQGKKEWRAQGRAESLLLL